MRFRWGRKKNDSFYNSHSIRNILLSLWTKIMFLFYLLYFYDMNVERKNKRKHIIQQLLLKFFLCVLFPHCHMISTLRVLLRNVCLEIKSDKSAMNHLLSLLLTRWNIIDYIVRDSIYLDFFSVIVSVCRNF